MARDQKLDELVAKLEATTPLRFSPPPKHWRGKARLVSNSRALTMRMRRAMIVYRLNQLASQQAGENGQGIAYAFQPLANAIQAVPAIKPVWQARTSEHLEQALDNAQDRNVRSPRFRRSTTATSRSTHLPAIKRSKTKRLVTAAKRIAKRRRGFSGAAKAPAWGPH